MIAFWVTLGLFILLALLGQGTHEPDVPWDDYNTDTERS